MRVWIGASARYEEWVREGQRGEFDSPVHRAAPHVAQVSSASRTTYHHVPVPSGEGGSGPPASPPMGFGRFARLTGVRAR